MLSMKKRLELLSQDKKVLAQSITLLESTRNQDRRKALQLLQALPQNSKNSLRVGVSGIPGVGKSTFLEALGKHALSVNPDLKIGVLTIDPSSPLQGGSILADRLRMPTLSKHPNVFIRPSPASGSLGGVGRHTRECISLLEAAGYELILIETLGVGQSEFDAAALVDVFLVLQMPATGDEWQAMKKGILELADVLIINKCDGALKAQASVLQKILELQSKSRKNQGIPVFSCSSVEEEGFEPIWKHLSQMRLDFKNLQSKRSQQNLFWFEKELLAQFEEHLRGNRRLKTALSSHRKLIHKSPESITAIEAEKALRKILRKEYLS